MSVPDHVDLPEFTIAVPANWHPLDLDPRTRTDTIAALVKARIGSGESDVLRRLRRELTGILRGCARQAANRGAIYAALLDQVVAGLAISASLVVAVGDAPRDADGRPVLDPDGLGAALAGERAPGGPGPDGLAADPFETLAGKGVRLRRTTDSGFANADGASVVTAESQYFVPVPGTDKALAMTFSTPNLSVRPALEGLFDAIARSLDWVWPTDGDPAE
ncbi:MAG TPA: hypothetical protein VLJ59_04535 [Mycobacteriales bacterium]|nr:hypothetical protein [Mycobacteriales bacterium]